MNTETLIYNAQILIGSARAGPGSTYAISIGNRACAAGWPWLAGSIVLTCFGVDFPVLHSPFWLLFLGSFRVQAKLA